MPLTVGLTGGIGAGKTTVAQLLAEHGAEVVSGDELGRIAVESSPAILDHIRLRFGPAVFDDSGRLRRRELGQRVFADLADARWLTEITRDPILELWNQRVRECPADVIVFDAALIYEWGVEDEFDLLVSVSAPPDCVAERMRSGGRLTADEVASRMTAQLDPRQKARRSQVLIHNDGTRELLVSRVASLWSTTIQTELMRKPESKHDHPRS
ncbi:dephospho-CoA kinase [candidate division KSB1 bacterium]|nr:dephospho-CoA kinase [candidate division KSB1 bacterium]